MPLWMVVLIGISWVIAWFIGAMWGESRGYNNGYEQAKKIWSQSPHS